MEGLSRIGFGLFGLAVLVGVAWLFSSNRRAVDWKLVATGISLQIGFAALVLLVPLKRLQQSKPFVTAMYQKLLVPKNCLITLKRMLSTVKVKKLISSMPSQILLVLVDTMRFLPSNVGRTNL